MYIVFIRFMDDPTFIPNSWLDAALFFIFKENDNMEDLKNSSSITIRYPIMVAIIWVSTFLNCHSFSEHPGGITLVTQITTPKMFNFLKPYMPITFFWNQNLESLIAIFTKLLLLLGWNCLLTCTKRVKDTKPLFILGNIISMLKFYKDIFNGKSYTWIIFSIIISFSYFE